MLVALIAGCATDEPRCGEAAQLLASCHGIDATAFRQACDSAAPDEATALADQVLAQSCPAAADGKADGLGEWAFVELCQPVMMSAYLVNHVRNPTGVALADPRKSTLRPYFGALVDNVRVHWSSTLPDDWPMLHIEDAFMDVGAQTFGSRIFAAHASASAPTSMLVHELTHAKQSARFGGASAFYREYCRGFYRGGFRYDANPLEVEAYAEETRITRCIANGC